MRAIVCVSTLQNPEESLSLTASETAFREEAAFEIVNDFDLVAVEAALRLKENGQISELIVFSAASSRLAIDRALAMGADSAYFWQRDNASLDADLLAEVLAGLCTELKAKLICLGKMDPNHESQALAAKLSKRLRCPAVFSVSALALRGEQLLAHCDEANGIALVQAPLPAIVSVNLRLAEPRYPSLPMLLKAKRKPVLSIEGPERAGGRLGQPSASLTPLPERKRTCQFLSLETLIQDLKR